jgi:hypothetical protein
MIITLMNNSKTTVDCPAKRTLTKTSKELSLKKFLQILALVSILKRKHLVEGRERGVIETLIIVWNNKIKMIKITRELLTVPISNVAMTKVTTMVSLRVKEIRITHQDLIWLERVMALLERTSQEQLEETTMNKWCLKDMISNSMKTLMKEGLKLIEVVIITQVRELGTRVRTHQNTNRWMTKKKLMTKLIWDIKDTVVPREKEEIGIVDQVVEAVIILETELSIILMVQSNTNKRAPIMTLKETMPIPGNPILNKPALLRNKEDLELIDRVIEIVTILQRDMIKMSQESMVLVTMLMAMRYSNKTAKRRRDVVELTDLGI